MSSDASEVYRAVEWLKNGKEEQQYQAVLALRSLAAESDNKDLIREAGGIQELIKLLDSGPDASLTIVSAETVCCLVADDQVNRELLRHFGGVEKLVRLLYCGPKSESTHRALLALRILTDKEVDRLAILRAGGVRPLVDLLSSGAESEITEYSAAALGNLAAGSQQIKDAIREAGGIRPLVSLLREDPNEISAELSAVVLRNLSLQNPTNRSEIQAAGGLDPLLRLLSAGQESLHDPLPCVAEYVEAKTTGTKTKSLEGMCCFDPTYGHLCIAPKEQPKFGCFGQTQEPDPRERSAERYSLLRKLTIVEAESNSLELNFSAAEKHGVHQIDKVGKTKNRKLQRLLICPCSATEVKGSIMRMLTRMHLEREFRSKHAVTVQTSATFQSASDTE